MRYHDNLQLFKGLFFILIFSLKLQYFSGKPVLEKALFKKNWFKSVRFVVPIVAIQINRWNAFVNKTH